MFGLHLTEVFNQCETFGVKESLRQLGPHDLTLKCTKTLDTIYSPHLKTNLSISWFKSTAVLQRLSLCPRCIQMASIPTWGRRFTEKLQDSSWIKQTMTTKSSWLLWCVTQALTQPFMDDESVCKLWSNNCFRVVLQTLLTAISMSAIATNGVVPGEFGNLAGSRFSPQYTMYSAVLFVVELLNTIFQAWKIIPVFLNKDWHKTESWCMLLFQSTGVTLISRFSSACSRKP